MSRSLLLCPLLPALLLGGCAGTANRSIDSVHQPVVTHADYSIDIGTADGGLAPGEGRRLAGWMSSLRLGYGDQVAIDDPAGDPGAHEAVADEAARFGLLLSDDSRVTGAPVAPGTLRVVVRRLKASVPGCPDYSRPSQPDFNSNTSSNFGCAINSNLAAMIANPADLVRGEPGSGTFDPVTSAKAINSLRAAAPSGGGGTTVKAESAGGK